MHWEVNLKMTLIVYARMASNRAETQEITVSCHRM